MAERTHFTNILLLSVLFGVLLLSGSLQCACDCLTRADDLHTAFLLQQEGDRTDSCHLRFEPVSAAISCPNKACHQRLPHSRDLSYPQIYQLVKLEQPLYQNSRQPEPQYRAGSPILQAQFATMPGLAFSATRSDHLPQTLYSIRSTVLRC